MNTNEILETINMIDNEDLDVRTITMGISLLDCIDPDVHKASQNVYDKICRYAQNLVKTGEDISRQYGIPIINKRISVTPIAMIAGACPSASPIHFAKALDRAAHTVGVNFVGGYSALVHKGFGPGDYALIESIPQALDETELVCSSVNVGTTKAGINMDAVEKMGRVIKETAQRTADRECIGAAKLVVFCNAPEDNPFMAGAFHGPGEPDCVINVGVSGPGVVRAAIKKHGEGCSPHRDRRADQAHRLQDHPYGPAGGSGGLPQALRALRHCGPVPGPHPRHRRQRGPYPGGDGLGAVRRPRHHRRSGPAQRRGEKGRRHGLLQRGRPLRRLYPRH